MFYNTEYGSYENAAPKQDGLAAISVLLKASVDCYCCVCVYLHVFLFVYQFVCSFCLVLFGKWDLF